MASFQVDLEDMEKAQAERPSTVRHTRRGSAAKVRAMKLVGGEGDYQESLQNEIDEDCDGKSFDNSSQDTLDEDIPDMMIRSQTMSFPSSDFAGGERQEHRVSIQETFLVPRTSLDVVDLETSMAQLDTDGVFPKSHMHTGWKKSERKHSSKSGHGNFLTKPLFGFGSAKKVSPVAAGSLEKRDSNIEVVSLERNRPWRILVFFAVVVMIVVFFAGLADYAHPSDRFESVNGTVTSATTSVAGSGVTSGTKELFGVLETSPSLSTPTFSNAFSSDSFSSFPKIVMSCEVSFDVREFDHVLLSHPARKRMHALPDTLKVPESPHGIFSCDSPNLAMTFLALDPQSHGFTRIRLRYALVVLYLELGGPTWSPSPSLWLSQEHECKWEGVGCSKGKLISLSLKKAGLKGSIPPQIGMLGDLRQLDLSGNPELSGGLPKELTSLEKLEKLGLDTELVVNDPLCSELSAIVEDLNCGDEKETHANL